ncbi:ABC transporter ATP-binding protein [uncultured Acidaminococcus sp.]|uniref:ABC transporter ATP-binding protein n=1 Tax=uncultured Acidaminococcus sp. TaxID=352152 RepID=UPI00294363C8|nr:ABC transporter ATP-binding protein [uncultured Acidaminococcus sp.]
MQETVSSGLTFHHVSKIYDTNQVVRDLDFSIQPGERLILLGPSGCGKTTTLRMIAGLESITSGDLYMGDTRVNDLAPGKRNIAMVFQSYALYPHMTVWGNITFGLKIQKLDPKEITRRTNEAVEILQLDGLTGRYPKELSGGQKQRVALARAIVKKAPYFLLDEPLSNLDAKLRQQARTQLVKIHELYRPTMIYVTHDQVEAMTVATRIAIINQGVLQQIGTPEEVYHRPANTFVAQFIGTPAMNLLPAQVHTDILQWGEHRLPVPGFVEEKLRLQDKVILGIRPEKCRFASQPMIPAKKIYTEDLGSHWITYLELPTGEKLQVSSPAPMPEDARGIAFDWQDVCFFDGTKEELL